jgi:hypothetical protein
VKLLLLFLKGLLSGEPFPFGVSMLTIAGGILIAVAVLSGITLAATALLWWIGTPQRGEPKEEKKVEPSKYVYDRNSYGGVRKIRS